MGGSTSKPKPGVALGGYGYALRAEMVDGAPAFVVPALVPPPAAATDVKEDAKAPLWEDCSLRNILTREQLTTVLRKINNTVLPLAFEAHCANVKVSSKPGQAPSYTTNTSADVPDARGGSMIYMRHTHLNMALLAGAMTDMFRAIAAPIAGLDAITLQVYNPSISRSTLGTEPVEFYLLFALTHENGIEPSATMGGAGGAGAGDGGDLPPESSAGAGGKALAAALGMPPPSAPPHL